MTEPSIYDLRRERGVLCEWCHKNESEQRHHCLIHDTARFHKELTVPENLMAVCGQCHTGDCKVNGYDVRLKFWAIQCERYGVDHMEDWINSLPIKLFYSRRIDFMGEMKTTSRLNKVVSNIGAVSLTRGTAGKPAALKSNTVYRIKTDVRC